VYSARNNYIAQYKKTQQSDQLKSAFLANISHEIRTPLNAIMGFTHILMKPELIQDKREQYSKLVMDNSRYLMNLMSDIIDISLIEAGQLKIAPYKFDLGNLVRRVHEIHSKTLKRLEKENIQFILSIPSSPFYVETDEFRVEQILTNLFHNAIKFTTHGHIRMGFFLEPNRVVIFIEDTGRGIPVEFQKSIFERFVKNEEGLIYEMNRGSGIGLSLCKELVEMLGGEIWFTSEYQKGSTFYFSLPIK
jgi:signal transduction histidine kinase